MKRFTFNLKNQLILNPTENLPYKFLNNNYRNLHGLYVSDKVKDTDAQFSSKIAFSGREKINLTVHQIYEQWKKALNTKYFTMRFLSGLHMHTLLFMSIANIGDTVALLPEMAGGHYATKKILQRLGLNVVELIPDFKNKCINVTESLSIIRENNAKFLFIDRSEGLVYENFTQLCANCNCFKIFDASQYLSHILCGDYISPISMGFDMVVSTIHKNFPGPQKAIAYSKDDSPQWKALLEGVSSYVSSLHIETTLMAGEVLKNFKYIDEYSYTVLENATTLRRELLARGLNIEMPSTSPYTQHIWLKCNTKEEAFKVYRSLEQCNILVNYRLLPYELGYGIRMGTAAATLCGLRPQDCSILAGIIADCAKNGATKSIMTRAKKFIAKRIRY